jgi:beta-glucanase (GH16 family)
MKLQFTLMVFALLAITACNNNKKESSGYQLVWSDEFNKDGLVDDSKWSYDTAGNAWGWGNREWQFYTFKDEDNAYVKDGFLHIVAIKEPMQGKDFSSARIRTKNKGDWKYGRMEINAKLPSVRGIWPAIWMLPTNNTYGNWPSSGEIDIMEHVGYMPDSVFASTHCQAYYFKIGTQKTKGYYLPDLASAFHTYALEWDSNEIRMFVDTVKYFNFKMKVLATKYGHSTNHFISC